MHLLGDIPIQASQVFQGSEGVSNKTISRLVETSAKTNERDIKSWKWCGLRCLDERTKDEWCCGDGEEVGMVQEDSSENPLFVHCLVAVVRRSCLGYVQEHPTLRMDDLYLPTVSAISNCKRDPIKNTLSYFTLLCSQSYNVFSPLSCHSWRIDLRSQIIASGTEPCRNADPKALSTVVKRILSL